MEVSRALLLLFCSLTMMVAPNRSAAPAAASEDHLTHIVVIDAGSTGTRLNYYAFKRNATSKYGVNLVNVLTLSTTPGLSSYMDNPDGAADSVVQLLQDGLFSSVPNPKGDLMVKATAGIRLLNNKDPQLANRIMATVNKTLYEKYGRGTPQRGPQFTMWPGAVGILPGVQEGDYGWLSVNFLLSQENQAVASNRPMGVMDLGGASTQITFQLREEVQRPPPAIKAGKKVKNKGRPLDPSQLLGYTSELNAIGRKVRLYSHSYLGLGQVSARIRALNVSNYCEMNFCLGSQYPVYETPCLHPSYSSNVKIGAAAVRARGKVGVDSKKRYQLCLDSMRPVVRDMVRPLWSTGEFQGPPPFVLLSSYYYTFSATGLVPVKIMNQGPTEITLKNIKKRAKSVCQNVAAEGDYAPFYCMNYAYYVALLRYGYQLPWDHRFRSFNEVDGFSPDWALGLALAEVYDHLYRAPEAKGAPFRHG